MLPVSKSNLERGRKEKRKMEKLGLLKSEKMGNYEKESGYASYRTVVERFVGDIVLCNNIAEIDQSVYDNLTIEEKYYNENNEEITEEEYYNDDKAYCNRSVPEIYQYYLCNVSDYEKKQCEKAGLILSYSNMLDCDVLCVDHFGTSWGYVLTNVKLFDDYDKLKKWESEESEDQ